MEVNLLVLIMLFTTIRSKDMLIDYRIKYLVAIKKRPVTRTGRYILILFSDVYE